MGHAGFVHLRLQSAYSMLEGAVQPGALAQACAEAGMPAGALCDRGNMFAAMDWSAAAKDAGLQPIMGALLPIERPGTRTATARPVIDWLPCLAQDMDGYHNLVRLVSAAHLEADGHEAPLLRLDQLEGRTGGLIALTGGAEGWLTRLIAEGQPVAPAADALAALFGDRLYVEISRAGDPVERRAEAGLLALASARGWPLVATNPVKFLEPEGHGAHDILLCIAGSTYVDAEDRPRSNPEHWLKDADAMRALFADLPEAIENTLVVAQRCAVMAPARKPILPHLEGGAEAEEARLVAEAEAGLAARLALLGNEGEAAAPYGERLAYELGVIRSMGFAGYFLIVAEFIGWAKAEGVPVGPGRGSGAGSVVAWALKITDLDPLANGLLFERFLNPDRVSMPDFDIDFCEDRREEVIRHVQSLYGREQVAQIITFGKMKARAVVKDVGRVLQMPYGQMDRLAKMIPNHPTDPWTLARALGLGRDKDDNPYEGVPELLAERERDAKVRRLLDVALQLEGLPRHSSTHAAGVVIGDRPLSELVPMYRDPRSDMPVTQFEMKAVEKAGLVKFDFLGLKTLSVLARAAALLAARGIVVDWQRLGLDDADVYRLIAEGDTVGVFQFESEGMRRALSQVRPDCFADIVALGALYRPGPMDNIPSYALRKAGREKVELLHERMEPILRETNGIIVYQEQVMQIARELAGYSLGEADLLRRAMGKKIHAEMVAQKARFAEGAATNGIEPATAEAIFELVLKFANYGFNKSHAAAYAVVSYQTAWLKTHHRAEFYVASMDYDIDNTDRLAVFVDDARRAGLNVLPPCINASEARFSVEDGAVRYGLAGLKSVGAKAMEAVVAARGDAPFASLADFAARVDPGLLNRRQLEALISAGAFDAVEPNRAGAHAMAAAILGTAQRLSAERESAQVALFGLDEGPALGLSLPDVEWTLAERLAAEKEAFGFYFSGHPIDGWAALVEARGAMTMAACEALPAPPSGGRQAVTMAGLIKEVKWLTSNNNRPQRGHLKAVSDRYLAVTLSDRSGQFRATCSSPETQERLERLAREDPLVLLQAELAWREGEDAPRVRIHGAASLAELARRAPGELVVRIRDWHDAQRLVELLAPAAGQGRGVVIAEVPTAAGLARVRLGADFLIDHELQAAAMRLQASGLEAPVRLSVVSGGVQG
ncbi:MAG: DNA polymerase III subunit alpha [Polymorphobacter sp.]|uniref:DNA polymerase III subunit alpha n=1 Tax=Polymorphobacter sp. TaxID=1909290 RepID=UPI003A8AEF77